MKRFSLVILLMAACCSDAAPTFLPTYSQNWGSGLGISSGPGWGGGVGGVYPGLSVRPAGYGFGGLSPYAGAYSGAYSQSPSYPGYSPGLYGLGYQNLRG